MKNTNRVVAACFVVLAVMMGCSGSDDVTNPEQPVGPQAEVVLEGTFADVIVPLASLAERLGQLLDAPKANPSRQALECPATEGVCSAGELVCDADSSGLHFTFDSCHLAAEPIVIHGGVTLSATGESSFLLALDTLSFDGGTPMNGGLELDAATCAQTWAVVTADGIGLAGTVFVCEGIPSADSSLTITIITHTDYWVFSFSFDGTAVASVTVVRDEQFVATCEMDMETFEADCSGT
jgi:hypothetical protein